MKKILVFTFAILACVSATAQRQWLGMGQLVGLNQTVYVFIAGPMSTSALIPKPPTPVTYTSLDLATIYSACGNSTCSGGTTITQPLTIAAGAQGTFYVPSGAGTYRISICKTAGSASGVSTDQVDPTGCSTVYSDPSCPIVVTNIAGDQDCGISTSTSLPAVPGAGNNRLISISGAAAAWTCDSGFDAITQTSAVSMSGTSSQLIASLTIGANRVCPSGLYTVAMSCKGTVAASMTASTFTPIVYFYNAANTTTYQLLGANASASVSAGTTVTINLTGLNLLAPASGAGLWLAGGQLMSSTAGASGSILGGPSAFSYGVPALLSTLGTNRIDVYFATSQANATANTVQCSVVGHS